MAKNGRVPKFLLSPGTFDGSQSWWAFKAKFRNCIEYNEWSDDEAKKELERCLVGPARLVLGINEDPYMTCGELIAALDLRYEGKVQLGIGRAKLEARRRKRGEPLISLMQDIYRLMTLAYIGPWSSETNLKAAKAFVKALSDSGEIYDKVKELEPQSVEEAYSFARRFEVQKLAESMASVQIVEPPDLEAGTKKRGVRQKGSRQKKRKAEEPLPEPGVDQEVVEEAEDSSRRRS